MLDHISLGVSDLARSLVFYDAALAPLGAARLWTSATGAGYGPPNPQGNERLALFQQDPPAAVLAAGPGFHLALTAPDRDAVDRFHSAAVHAGGRDNGGPGLREHYAPTYYAAFVIDPDGHRLEAVHQ